MENEKNKRPWYLRWWCLIIILFTLPISLPVLAIYLVWKKTNWHKIAKIAATIAVLIVWVKLLPAAPPRQPAQKNPTAAVEKNDPIKQEEKQPDPQQTPEAPQAKPAFDIPSLFGKNITEIRTALGGKPKTATTPTKAQLQIVNNIWSEEYHNDDTSLSVTYNYKTLTVKDFFIFSNKPGADTDKNTLATIGNFNLSATEYRVKFVTEQKDSNRFTGAVITPPQTLQAIIAERQKFDQNLGNNFMAAQTTTALIKTFKSVSFDGNLTIKASDDAEKDYASGGDENDYRKQVTTVRLSGTIDGLSWSYAPDSTKKDFVTALVNSLKQSYPESSVWVDLSNGIRTVAKGQWSNWSGTSVDLQ